jgi:hypothetical protein
VHAKPTAQQLAPQARSGGQQVAPLFRHCPLQHWPLQQVSSGPQQFAPHWKFGVSQQVVPFRQLCDGQHVLPQTSATLQHVTGAMHVCPGPQQLLPQQSCVDGQQVLSGPQALLPVAQHVFVLLKPSMQLSPVLQQPLLQTGP